MRSPMTVYSRQWTECLPRCSCLAAWLISLLYWRIHSLKSRKPATYLEYIITKHVVQGNLHIPYKCPLSLSYPDQASHFCKKNESLGSLHNFFEALFRVIFYLRISLHLFENYGVLCAILVMVSSSLTLAITSGTSLLSYYRLLDTEQTKRSMIYTLDKLLIRSMGHQRYKPVRLVLQSGRLHTPLEDFFASQEKDQLFLSSSSYDLVEITFHASTHSHYRCGPCLLHILSEKWLLKKVSVHFLLRVD